jgi:hypothetical protein
VLALKQLRELAIALQRPGKWLFKKNALPRMNHGQGVLAMQRSIGGNDRDVAETRLGKRLDVIEKGR